MDLQDLDLDSKVHEIMLEAIEAVQKNASKLRELQRGADCLQSVSEVSSIPRTCQGCLRQASRSASNLCGEPTAAWGT
jgi:hypothetical protein